MAVPGQQLNQFGFLSFSELVQADEQGRLALGRSVQKSELRAYIGPEGQILLDPLEERDPGLWLWESPALKKAIEDALQRE